MEKITIRGFSEKGNWYKGNLHSHTVNSDGMLTPEQSVKLFKEHGFHFCVFQSMINIRFTERNLIVRTLLSSRGSRLRPFSIMTTVPAGERKCIISTVSSAQREMQKNAALPPYQHNDIHPVHKYYGEWDGCGCRTELADEMIQHGMIATYNHPIWSRVRESEFINTEGIWALEIFNYNTVNESYTGYDETYFDVMLREGKKIFAFASDDIHNEGLFDDACGGYIVVKADKLTHEDIVQNMLAGNYYSSSGPEIYDWGIRDGVAYVDCSPGLQNRFYRGE